jgi:DNA-binding LacI/PurR family transcriptional regulator
MRRLWAQPERPDGLVVFPDSIASGAIHALLALGVKVPDDLRLVLHRNRGVPLLCPLPATFLEADPDEMAAVLVRQVRELHAGKQVRKVCLRHQVVKQDSPANPTGEASIPDSKTVMSRGSGIPSAVSPSVMRRRT